MQRMPQHMPQHMLHHTNTLKVATFIFTHGVLVTNLGKSIDEQYVLIIIIMHSLCGVFAEWKEKTNRMIIMRQFHNRYDLTYGAARGRLRESR